MEFRPILSAMLRNKTGAVLVGMQIALTLAVVANAVFIIMQRVERINTPHGVDTPNLIFAQSYGFGPGYDHLDTIRRDLDLLRALPGVVAATSSNGIPMSSGGRSSGYTATTDPKAPRISANYYSVDEDAIEAFGLKLLEGRGFRKEEVQYNPNASNSDPDAAVIITRSVAEQLFGTEDAVGKTIYDGLGQPGTVVGVIENMLNAWITAENPTNVMFVPRITTGPVVKYAIRTEPGRRDALIPEIERVLADSNTNRAVNFVRPHDYYVAKIYKGDSRMVIFLSVIIALMIAVTALGIVGLASFHVNVRTKQIGTRRAIGARRVDIIRYFMVENWILTTGGVAMGTLLAFAFGYWLSVTYSLPRLQPMYVIVGVVALWILGQLAVFVPARRAAAIPPAIATRTV